MPRNTRLPQLGRRNFLLGSALGLGALSACSNNSGSGGKGPVPSGMVSSSAKARAGGTLRFGYFGGSAADKLDAQFATTDFGIAIGVQLNSALLGTDVARLPDGGFRDVSAPVLAESIELEGPTTVVVRLKPDLQFHSGQPITADDVMASFARILNPKSPGAAAPSLSRIDLQSSRVVDKRTARFELGQANAFILDGFANNLAAIYPGGEFDPKNGSGPFRYERYTAASSAEFSRFENYHEPALLERLIIQNFADDTAKLNALRSGAIDLAGKIQPSLVSTLGSEHQVYSSKTGSFVSFVMDAASPEFRDPRVRQAFRLLIDRPALVDQLLSGAGTVANDLSSPFDDAYIGDELPQREQDIEQAKSLLKAAGKEGMTLTMASSGLLPNLEVAFAQQAKAAGVTIEVKQVDSTTFFTQHYGQDPFYVTSWPNVPVSTQLSLAIAPGAYFPEGNWDNPEFPGLWEAAMADQNEDSRNEKLGEIQRLFHEDGTHIIWSFADEIDAASTKVAGLVQDTSGYPVSFFDFTEVGFA
jgi:peptide/nickel transport system substrate-binding protein